MPLSKKHKKQVHDNIVESARILFNRNGFKSVSIDMVMKHAGLTHGGFYNHFKNKDELYEKTVSCFLMGPGAIWRADAGIDSANLNSDMARKMVQSYLSPEHLRDLDGQYPMIALPSDVARASSKVQSSYQNLLLAMVSLFEDSLKVTEEDVTPRALSLAALCVGGMVLARTLPDSELASDIQNAAKNMANSILSNNDL